MDGSTGDLRRRRSMMSNNKDDVELPHPPQLSPSHSWKLILPCVVSAEKFGKVSASFAMFFRSGGCGESVAITRGKTVSRRIGLVE